MPPKKRASRGIGKKSVSFGNDKTSSISSGSVTATGRPTRAASQNVQYTPPSARTTHDSRLNAKTRKDSETGPTAVSPPLSPLTKDALFNPANRPKRRGRPPKAKEEDATNSPVETQMKKRKREADETATTAAPAKKRGRPAKADVKELAPTVKAPASKARAARAAVTQKEKATTNSAKATTTAPAKRGRPARTAADAPATKRGRPAKASTATTTTANTAPAKKRGRPAKAASKKSSAKEDEAQTTAPLVEDEDESDLQYWLMKAEPETRMVKGIDVAYPIEKLAQATDPEPWDGVRNPVARNNMRAMRKSDLAFFYHSNCTTPGIVGVMRIAEEHSVDQSAFDATHPYYDEKSDPAKPKWDCVKVEFVKKFANPITLRELKSTPELANMQIAQNAYGRLSVQKVTPAQWRFVLNVANEPEDLGVTSAVSGYEADTNGETDAEMVDAQLSQSPKEALEDDDDVKIDAYGTPDPEEDDEAEGKAAPAAPIEVDETA